MLRLKSRHSSRSIRVSLLILHLLANLSLEALAATRRSGISSGYRIVKVKHPNQDIFHEFDH